MKDKQLFVLGVLLAVFCVTMFWWYRNQRGALRRGSKLYKGPTGSSRASDLKILTPQEERIAKQALKLSAKGQVRQAAHMYEQIGLHREAISILEESGFVDDAAKVLLRMQKPSRAAVIYTRNGYWKEAAACFLQAGQPVEAANAFREAGLTREAAELFAKEGQLELAAQCFEANQLYLEASRHWLRAQKIIKSRECLIKFASTANPSVQNLLTKEEFDTILEIAKQGQTTSQLIAILANSPKIAEMIREVINEDKVELAILLYQRAPEHIAGTLLSAVNIQSNEAKVLADIFSSTGNFRYAAMLFEQLGEYKLAAESFERAGDMDRASYCLERLGIKRSKQVHVQDQSAAPSNEGHVKPRGGFYIETGEVKAADPNHEDKTVQISMNQNRNDEARESVSESEIKLLRRDWLFEGCSEDDLDVLTSSFTAADIDTGKGLKSGSRETYLIMVSAGSLISDYGEIGQPGRWLGPELALSGSDPLSWTAKEPSRVLVISATDFDQLLRINSEMTRNVYTNLTSRLLQLNHNPLKQQAI